MATEGSVKAVVTAMFANLGIAVTKFVAFLLTASSSMLAESVHSLADTSNQALLLLGGNRAKRAATPEHPFGYGRERYVYAFIVSIVLFSIGGLFALYEAWHKWSDPHPIDSWQWVPIAVLLVAMTMEAYALRTAVVESNRVRADRSWKEFVRSATAPELPVILLEDCGALLGLLFALFGVSMNPGHAADPAAVMPAMSGRGRLQISRACSAGTPKMFSRSSAIWSLACASSRPGWSCSSWPRASSVPVAMASASWGSAT